MTGHGFRCERRSLRYRRQSPRSLQEIDLAFDTAPRYAPGSLFVLQPQVRVEYPESAALTEIAGQVGTGVAVLQPMAFGREDGGRTQWAVQSERDIDQVAIDLRSEMEKRVIPLMEDLIDPEGLLVAYEKRDTRISWHVQVVASVIAILLTNARPREALVVAHEWFRGSSLEHQYPRLSARLSLETNG